MLVFTFPAYDSFITLCLLCLQFCLWQCFPVLLSIVFTFLVLTVSTNCVKRSTATVFIVFPLNVSKVLLPIVFTFPSPTVFNVLNCLCFLKIVSVLMVRQHHWTLCSEDWCYLWLQGRPIGIFYECFCVIDDCIGSFWKLQSTYSTVQLLIVNQALLLIHDVKLLCRLCLTVANGV
jgi:hypothetical protein